MKKLVITLFAVAVSCSSSLFGATIALNKGLSVGFNVRDKDGALTAGTVFIGTFAGGTAPAAPSGTDYSSIISSFRIFGSIATPAAGTAISGNVTATPATPANFNSLQMYMIVANSSVLSEATQFVLVTNTTPTFFPADVVPASSTNFNVTTFASLSIVAGAGSKIDNSSGAESLRMIAVPEPSVALLGALGALGLIRRRR